MMRNHGRLLMAGLWLALLGVPGLAATFELARDGKPATSIVVAPDASAASRQAAANLQAIMGRMSGATFVVETGDGSSGVAVGVAGEFPLLANDTALRLGERFGPTDLATRQGYVLRAHADGLQIIGASEVGVVYGAWDVLHRLGYRYLAPQEAWEIVPEKPDLAISVDVFEKPDFISRHIAGSVTREWNERHRVSIGYSWKLELLPYLPEHWQKPLVQNHHNWGAIIGFAEEEFAAHPEYLGLVEVKVDPNVIVPDNQDMEALRKGEEKLQLAEPEAAEEEQTVKRRASSKLCVSNPRVRELAVAYALDYFRQHPDAPSISMEPTDGSGWCICEGCAAIGPPSERVMLLANTVAAGLEAEFPDKYVGLLAYHLHADPPRQQAHPRVCVSLATQLSGSKSIDQRLAEWAPVCQNLGVYEYLSVMEWHLGLPAKSKVANLPFLARTLPNFHAQNVRFFTGQATGGAWGGQALGFYVLSHLLWDSTAAEDIEPIVDDFLVSGFGAAAEPMRDYYHVVDGSQAAPGSGEFFLGRARLMFEALRQAKQATDDPAVQRRINQLVLYTRYVELFGQEVVARKKSDHHAALVRLARFAYRIRGEQMIGWGVVRGYIKGVDAVPLRPEPAATDEDLSLGEPKPVTPYVDTPVTEEEIAAILAGTSVIPIDDTKAPDMPGTTPNL